MGNSVLDGRATAVFSDGAITKFYTTAVWIDAQANRATAVAREERSQHRNKALALERLAQLKAAQAAADEAAQRARRNKLHPALERGRPVRCFKGHSFCEVKGG